MLPKKSNSAPFGSKTSRFDLNIVHPRWRCQPLSPAIGPGTYIEPTCFMSFKPKKGQISDWRRKYELERQSEIPKLLCRKQVIELEEKKRALGPGTYNIPIECFKRHCFTQHGPIDTSAPRFPDEQTNSNPGVGTYGLGGDPHAYKELMDAAHKFGSTVGLLNNGGSGDRTLPLTGCRLGPGTYELRDSLKELLDKVVSHRGPYDLTTGPRNKTLTSEFPDPGTYEVKSFVNDLTRPGKQHCGKFRRIPDPILRTRIKSGSRSTQSVHPLTEVSPATYDPIKPAKKARSSNRKNVPFLNGARRSALAYNKTPVGPGRYDVELYDDSRCVWGAMCAFDSQTAARRDVNYLQRLGERLRPTNIPEHAKDRTNHFSTEREPCAKLPPHALGYRRIPLIS